MDELFFNGYSVSPWAKVVEIVLWLYNTVNVLHAIELYIFKNDSDHAEVVLKITHFSLASF